MVREVLTAEALSALQPRVAAAYLIARRAEGLARSEEQLLEAWLAKNEEHRRMFESADRAWQTFANPEDDEILAAMRAHALAPRPKTLATWRPAIAAAAAVLLIVGAALYLGPALHLWVPQSPPPGAASVEAMQFESSRGVVKDIVLADGSNMTLDADSAAVGRISAIARNVQLLRGRALFTVVPDRSRPFEVVAAGRSVVAVGTRFEINLAGDALTVTLLDGHVTIGSPNSAREPVTLEAGQQYLERNGTASVRTIGPASEKEIAWRVGLVNFDDEPLSEASAVMNRYSTDQIVIHDPAVASIRVSGQFRAGETERFAATVAEMHKLRWGRRVDQIELVRPK